MNTKDLTTTECVERWAETVACHSTGYATPNEHECWDTGTAAYIAECVRLRAAFDEFDEVHEIVWRDSGDDRDAELADLRAHLRDAMKVPSK